MDTNLKDGKLKECIIPEHFNSRESELTLNSENSNLLGFRGNTMVFETLASDHVKTEEKLLMNKIVGASKKEMESKEKKFLVLNGKKFQIVKSKNEITANIKKKMEINRNRRILPKGPSHTGKCTSVILRSVHPGQNLLQINDTPPTSVTKFNTDLCAPSSKSNAKSENYQIIENNSNSKGSDPMACENVTDSQRNLVFSTPNVTLENEVELGGTLKLLDSTNKGSQIIAIKPESLNKISKSDNSQLSMMTSLLVVPSQLDSNGCVKSCNCNVQKNLVSTYSNTDGISVVSREVQTEEPFDYLLDSLLNQCLHAEKSESVITGKNVNMGFGPPSVPVENNAKARFFLDLQNCLVWDSGNLLIHKGVIQSNLGLVKRQCVMLKARNAGVNIMNSSNFTPLQLAVIHNVSIEIVQLLLSYKADMSILDPEGNNVLHLAVENNRKDLVKLFLDHMHNSTINIDHFNYNGLTPLMLCAFDVDRIDMAENLLKMGAQPNLRDLKSGRTVLFHGAENHNTPIVSLLLDYSADTKIRNFFGTSIHDAVFELEDIPNEIKYPILGRDLKLHQRRKLNLQDGTRNADELKRTKLQIVPTYQKIKSNTKFVVNTANNKS